MAAISMPKASHPPIQTLSIRSSAPHRPNRRTKPSSAGPTSLGRQATNQFGASLLYSDAPFEQSNPSAANSLFPYFFGVGDGSLSYLNATATFTPQGRRIVQYQVTDDFSYTSGIHALKIGINYHRDLIHDYDFGMNTAGELFLGSLDDVFNGVLGPYGVVRSKLSR